jgi:hypothetical protein
MQRHRPLFIVLLSLISVVGLTGSEVYAQSARQKGQQNAPDYRRSAGTAAAPQSPAENAIGPGNRFRGVPPVQGQPGWSPQPLFPTLLGNTVGLHAFPSVTTLPGYGNINQPGRPPNAPIIYPNINNPSGLLNGTVSNQRPHGPQGYARDSGTVVYYVPYYVAPAPSAQNLDSSGANYASGGGTDLAPIQTSEPQTTQSTPQSLQPTTFVDEPVKPEATNQQSTTVPTDPTLPVTKARKAKQVTLLAFQDGLIVGVTDYWLEKFTLIYLRSGLRTEVPLEQLDLKKTVQLNRELGVPLELESR